MISLNEFYSTSNRNVRFRGEPGFFKEGEGVVVADTTKGIHDRVSIDTLDQPSTNISIDTRSGLGQHSIDTPSTPWSTIGRVSTNSYIGNSPSLRQATDMLPTVHQWTEWRLICRSSIDRGSIDSIDRHSIADAFSTHDPKKTIREPNFFSQIIFHSLGVHLFIICNFTTCVKLLSP